VSAAPELPGIFHALQPVLQNYGYLAVGGLVLLEDFGVPVPGETVLIAAAIYAGAGRLNVVAVGALAFAAAVVGDNIGYVIGRFGGRELALRWGRYVFLTPERLGQAEDFFRRHGGKVVTVARFIEVLRQANGIIAGISRMPWRQRFLPFQMLGAALWVGLWTSVGYLAGSNINKLYKEVTRYELYFAIVVAALFAAYVAYRALAHRRRKRGAAAAGERGGKRREPESSLPRPR
jgi:membrane protein DedA with SNARE-associated domain